MNEFQKLLEEEIAKQSERIKDAKGWVEVANSDFEKSTAQTCLNIETWSYQSLERILEAYKKEQGRNE